MRTRDTGGVVELLGGVGLVMYGGLFLLAEAGGERGWTLVWPLFVIVPGLLLFAAMFALGPGAGFLAVPGSIFIVSGVALAVTNTLGTWASWSYTWALVSPGSVGVGLWIYGAWSGLPTLRRAGAWLALAGVVLFVLLGAIVQLAFGIPGPGGGTVAAVVAPLLLIAAGVWLVVTAIRRR